jgi:hypothetical protein
MSKKQQCILIIVFILFIVVGISKAEPTPTISYLMKTPVSMLDFGIFKLEKELDEWADRIFGDARIVNNRPLTKVEYLYSSNRIKIKLSYTFTGEKAEKDIQKVDVKSEIIRVLKRLKFLKFGLSLKTQKPVKDYCSTIDRFFSHQGYVLKNEPKNLGKELDQITKIYVELWNGKDWVKCKSPLIGNKVYWEK